jgi:hypothetical protein
MGSTKKMKSRMKSGAKKIQALSLFMAFIPSLDLLTMHKSLGSDFFVVKSHSNFFTNRNQSQTFLLIPGKILPGGFITQRGGPSQAQPVTF